MTDTGSEHADQVALIAWAAMQSNVYPALKWIYAVPNGAKLPYRKNRNGQRFSPEAMRLKREGLRPGVPDLVLPVPVGKHHGLYLELKHGKNTTSDKQDEWLEALEGFGYCAAIAWGFDEARQTIVDYLEGRL